MTMKENISRLIKSCARSIIKTGKQLRLLFSGFTFRTLLLNRFTIVLILSLLTLGSVQGYITMNSEGVIEGTVVDEDGNPVEGAEVDLIWQSIEAQHRSQSTTTDENGRFVFENQDRYLEYRITAKKDGSGSEGKRLHRLYEGQSREIHLVLD